ncbi:MAG TPA: hypothetical protein VLH77_04240 [Gammaproteobacteria bacterium]|nr:hypothetical protein [Gammaproteobacteria bacterium]
MPHTRKTRNLHEEMKEENKPDYLSALPDDFFGVYLFSFLTPSEEAQLAKTSQRFFNLPEGRKAVREEVLEFNNQLRQLLWFVAHGKKRQAEALISQNPLLLLAEAQTSDFSYYYRNGKRYQRRILGAPLGIALGAEDVNLYDKEGKKLLGEGMVEMILRHLRRLPEGEEVIARQMLKQFPKGWEAREKKRQVADLHALLQVRQAIKNSSYNADCQAAILEFINHLAPKALITEGKHWNANLLQSALELGHLGYFHDPRKDNLYYNFIVAYIQTLAPANFAMAQAQGLKELLDQGKYFKRKLKYLRSAGEYYPLCSEPGSRLGIDAWVDPYQGAIGGSAQASRWGLGRDLPSLYFQNYLEAKTAVLQQIIAQLNHPSRRCVVM